MTWHSFFNLSTMEHSHLLFAYITIWVVQGGYFARLLWQWRKTKPVRQ